MTAEERQEAYNKFFKRQKKGLVFYQDTEYLDASEHNPPRGGKYMVICGDGEARRCTWIKPKMELGYWRDGEGFRMPQKWYPIKAWKPIDLGKEK